MLRVRQSMVKLVAALGVTVLTASCSSLPQDQYQDPFEGYNRRVHNFNEDLDRTVVRPVTEVYAAITPDPVETGISNFFANLMYPTVVLNQFLQGKPGEGFKGVARFTINSTIGIVGIFDVASQVDLPPEREDFGQTFAKWGFGSGPYVVLHGLGGMTLRDGIGRAASIPVNPAFYLEDDQIRYGLAALSAVDRSALALEARELIRGDSYLFLRDGYLQQRQYLISDNVAVETDPFLDE